MFDEVDVGVGGRMAERVGRMREGLADALRACGAPAPDGGRWERRWRRYAREAARNRKSRRGSSSERKSSKGSSR